MMNLARIAVMIKVPKATLMHFLFLFRPIGAGKLSDIRNKKHTLTSSRQNRGGAIFLQKYIYFYLYVSLISVAAMFGSPASAFSTTGSDVFLSGFDFFGTCRASAVHYPGTRDANSVLQLSNGDRFSAGGSQFNNNTILSPFPAITLSQLASCGMPGAISNFFQMVPMGHSPLTTILVFDLTILSLPVGFGVMKPQSLVRV